MATSTCLCNLGGLWDCLKVILKVSWCSSSLPSSITARFICLAIHFSDYSVINPLYCAESWPSGQWIEILILEWDFYDCQGLLWEGYSVPTQHWLSSGKWEIWSVRRFAHDLSGSCLWKLKRLLWQTVLQDAMGSCYVNVVVCLDFKIIFNNRVIIGKFFHEPPTDLRKLVNQ